MSVRTILALGLAAATAVVGRPLSAGDDGAPAPRPAVRDGPAPAVGPHTRAGSQGHGPWRWPLRPRPPVLRPFAAPPTPFGPGHRGLYLGVPGPAEVRAVADGAVTHSGAVAGRGTVTVAHAGGLSSTYEPVLAVVREGTVVEAGDLLGTVDVGAAGHCGATACLHLGARRGADYLDPLPLLVGGRVVLLPLGAAG
jgi:murein DD-endopeptidase MepM/ murein hydrolase activator NlpD